MYDISDGGDGAGGLFKLPYFPAVTASLFMTLTLLALCRQSLARIRLTLVLPAPTISLIRLSAWTLRLLPEYLVRRLHDDTCSHCRGVQRGCLYCCELRQHPGADGAAAQLAVWEVVFQQLSGGTLTRPV